MDCFASLAMTGSLARNLQRQFRLAPRVTLCGGCRSRGAGADKTPADAGGVALLLLDHDLGGAARAVIAGEEDAVLKFDLVVERLEGPDVAVGQHQHDAAGVAEPARLHRRVQMKPQRVIAVVALDPPARRRVKRILAVEPGAVMR